MRTEDLIASLAREPRGTPAGSLTGGVGLAIAAGLPLAVVLFWLMLGPRPGLGAALSDPVTAAKTVLPLILGLLALVLSLRLARPAGRPGLPGSLAFAVPLVAAALVAGAVLTIPAAERLAVFVGHSIRVCLPSIVIISTPLLAALITALRRGAPEHPVRLGALAGLAAGGLAAAVYSLFCTEDSPLFYVFWYGTGIGIVTALGALIGSRALRW